MTQKGLGSSIHGAECAQKGAALGLQPCGTKGSQDGSWNVFTRMAPGFRPSALTTKKSFTTFSFNSG